MPDLEKMANRRSPALPAAGISPLRPHHIVHMHPPGYIHTKALTEMAETIYYGCQHLGVPVTYIQPPPPGARWIVFGAHLLNEQVAPQLPADAIIFNSEQMFPGSPWLISVYLDILRSHAAWDYSTENIDRLAQFGVKAIHVPLGYVPELARIAPATEDIDVLFYGLINPRRQQMLEQLKDRGLNVVSLTGIYGEERDAYIARAKVVLNLHYYVSKVFETVRVSYLLTNAKAVVAEVNPDTSIPPELRDCVLGAPYEELADACANLVRDDHARQQLAARGKELFARLPVEPALAQALQHGNTH